MHLVGDEVADGLVDETVPRHPVAVAEARAHHHDVVVPGAASGAGMADVRTALVAELDVLGLETQAHAIEQRPRAIHVLTCRVTSAHTSHPPSARVYSTCRTSIALPTPSTAAIGAAECGPPPESLRR